MPESLNIRPHFTIRVPLFDPLDGKLGHPHVVHVLADLVELLHVLVVLLGGLSNDILDVSCERNTLLILAVLFLH